jgi:uncharacterized protein
VGPGRYRERADIWVVTSEVATSSLPRMRHVTTPDEGEYEALSRLGELGREIERRCGPDPYLRPNGPAPSLEALRRYRDDVMQIAARHGARTVSVFGSVARGDAGRHSDLDLLVDTGDPQSLFEQAALRSDLEDLLGCPVHVLTTGGLSCARENTRAQIKPEAISP